MLALTFRHDLRPRCLGGPTAVHEPAATTIYLELVARLEEEEVQAPASPAIADFVAEALAIWPDLGSPGDEGLLQEASGSFLYFPLTFSAAEAAVPVLSRMARRRRLVCYDPQAERLA